MCESILIDVMIQLSESEPGMRKVNAGFVLRGLVVHALADM